MHTFLPRNGGNSLERSDPCEKKEKIIFTTRSYLSRTRVISERGRKKENVCMCENVRERLLSQYWRKVFNLEISVKIRLKNLG